ncbi:MAG: peptidylprolyl isomerase [Gemmatimonadota bacterium]|nr:peptidylprolyl isomerase [Gemmatimonadota bacterium]MDH4350037.1 peptidylprolyl isomerase [Gemmatimonadota bacterium]MDH5196940.1 peptidylprolyl isomerase [Gemmatimonadota bacterium]
MAASAGDKVRVHYTGRLDDDTVFDSSEGRDPIEFVLGTEAVIRGFEAAVLGLEVGDRRTVVLGPEDAYGPYHHERVVVVGRERFPVELTIEPGMVLRAQGENGDLMVTVTDITDDRVTIDGNHPLAGKQLTFDIELTGLEPG